jgi:hypothetical protein
LSDPEKTTKKRKQFEVDPSIFQPGPRETKLRRYLIEPAKSLARASFYVALFAYPLSLVITGVIFGGAAFWGLLGGSMVLIGVVLWKGGYAKHYESWNINLKRQLIGTTLGSLLAIGFFVGIAFLQVWLIPVFLGIMILGLVVILKTYKF